MRWAAVPITALAVIAALLAGLARAAPHAAAAPAATGASIHPGTPLSIGLDLCTAGFAVRNQRGATLIVTAGHCDVGGPAKVKSGGSWFPAAEFAYSVYVGDSADEPDIAVLNPASSVTIDPAVDALMPVRASVPYVAEGMTLCHLGAVSGRSCGPVVVSSRSKVKFAASIAPGDSGGPVWGYTSKGAAFAVGIVIRQSDADGYPVAELIEPWLTLLNLSLA